MHDDDAPKSKLLKTVVIPVIVASLFAAALFIFVPQVGAFAAISAWIGTVLFMSIWGSFYS